MRFVLILVLIKALPGLVLGYTSLQSESCTYRKWGRDGTVKLLVVAGLHENEGGSCGQMSRAVGPAVMALDWMLSKLNGDLDSTGPYIPGVTIGYDLYDNCDNADVTTDLLFSGTSAGQTMDCTGDTGNQSEYIAVVALTNMESTHAVSRITHPTSVFHPVTSPKDPDQTSVIHTAASFQYEAETTISFLQHHQWNMVVIVHTSDEYGRKSSSSFSDSAIKAGLCVTLTVEADDPQTIPSIHTTMQTMTNQTLAVVFYGDQIHSEDFVSSVNKEKRPRGSHILWIFSSLINRKPAILPSDYFFMISDPELEFGDFEQYFRDVINNATHSPINNVAVEYSIHYGYDFPSNPLIHIVDTILSVAHVLNQSNCVETNTCASQTLHGSIIGSSLTINDHFDDGYLPQSYKAANRHIHFTDEGFQKIDRLTILDEQNQVVGQFNTQDGFTATKAYPTLSSSCYAVCEGCRDQQEIRYSYLHGEVFILGLFSLRTYGDNPYSCGEFRGTCTDTLSVSAFMEYILTQRASEGIQYGGIALDDCYNALNTTHFLLELFSKRTVIRNPHTGEAINFDNVVAIVGALSSPVSVVVADFATALGIPMISYSASSPELDDRNRYPYFFRTVPSDTLQVKGMLNLLQNIGVTHIGAVYIDDTYGKTGILKLQQEAEQRQICIEKPFVVTQDISDEALERLIDALYEQQVRVVVYFSIESISVRMLRLMPGSDKNRPPLIFIASEAWGRNENVLVPDLGKVAIGTLVFNIANRLESNERFKEYLRNMTVNENKHNRWVPQLFEDYNKCDLLTSFEKKHTNNGVQNICTTKSKQMLDADIIERLANGQRVVHIAHALKAVMIGYKLFCNNRAGFVCMADARENTAAFASTISRVSQNNEPLFDADHNGNIGYTIYNIQLIESNDDYSFEYVQVGSFSVDGRLTLTQKPVFYNDVQKNISIRDVYETDCLNYDATCSNVCREPSTSLPPVTSTPTPSPIVHTEEENSTMLVTTIVFAVLLGILAIALVLVIVILLRRSPRKDQSFAPSQRSNSFDKTYDVLSGHYNVPHMSSDTHNGRRNDGSQLSIRSQPVAYADIRHRSHPDLRFNHIRHMSSPEAFQMTTLPKYNKSPHSKQPKSSHTSGAHRASAAPKTPHSAPSMSTLERRRRTADPTPKFRYPSIQDESRYTDPTDDIELGNSNFHPARSRAGTDPEIINPPSHSADSYITPTSDESRDTSSDHKITYLTAKDLVQESSDDEEDGEVCVDDTACSIDTDTGYLSANPSSGNGDINDQNLLEKFSYNPNLTSPSDTEVSKINFPTSPTSPSNQSPLTEIPDVLRHGRYDTDDNVFMI